MTAMLKLSRGQLDFHLTQRIAERGSLGHLYTIEMDTEGGPTASMHQSGAESLWNVVQAAIHEAGWRIVPR